LTEFETPTGVASVRGTKGSIGYDKISLTAIYDLIEGLLSYDGKVYTFDMETGLTISVQATKDPAGQISASINVVGGSTTITTAAGIAIDLGPGDTIGITINVDNSGKPTGVETIEQKTGNSTMTTNTGTANLTTRNIVTITVQGVIEELNIDEGIIDFTDNDDPPTTTTIGPGDPPIQNTLPEPPAAGPGDPPLQMPELTTTDTTTDPAAEVPQNLKDDPPTPATPTG
jgi:hypothetical protein